MSKQINIISKNVNVEVQNGFGKGESYFIDCIFTTTKLT